MASQAQGAPEGQRSASGSNASSFFSAVWQTAGVAARGAWEATMDLKELILDEAREARNVREGVTPSAHAPSPDVDGNAGTSTDSDGDSTLNAPHSMREDIDVPLVSDAGCENGEQRVPTIAAVATVAAPAGSASSEQPAPHESSALLPLYTVSDMEITTEVASQKEMDADEQAHEAARKASEDISAPLQDTAASDASDAADSRYPVGHEGHDDDPVARAFNASIDQIGAATTKALQSGGRLLGHAIASSQDALGRTRAELETRGVPQRAAALASRSRIAIETSRAAFSAVSSKVLSGVASVSFGRTVGSTTAASSPDAFDTVFAERGGEESFAALRALERNAVELTKKLTTGEVEASGKMHRAFAEVENAMSFGALRKQAQQQSQANAQSGPEALASPRSEGSPSGNAEEAAKRAREPSETNAHEQESDDPVSDPVGNVRDVSPTENTHARDGSHSPPLQNASLLARALRATQALPPISAFQQATDDDAAPNLLSSFAASASVAFHRLAEAAIGETSLDRSDPESMVGALAPAALSIVQHQCALERLTVNATGDTQGAASRYGNEREFA